MRRMVADSRGFNPRMRYFNQNGFIRATINNSMSDKMKPFLIVYRNMYEQDQTKWKVHADYELFSQALDVMMRYYQFKGMQPDYGWWICKIGEDGKMIKLNHDGTPI